MARQTAGAALVVRAERELSRGAADRRHVERVEKFGEQDAETLSAMDEINRRLQDAAVPPNTRRAMQGGAAAWVRFCDSARISYATVEASSLQTFGAWLVDRGREVKSGGKPRGYSEASARNRATMALKWMRDVEGINLSASDVHAPTRGINHAIAVRGEEGTLERGTGRAKHVRPEQVDAMVLATDGRRTADYRDRALILVSFAIAARTAETAGLQVGHIDRRDPDVYVISIVKAKTKASVRDVTVSRDHDHPELCPVRAIDAWLEVLAGYGKAEPGMPLFPGVNRAGQPGGRMTAQSVRDAIKRAGVRAGIRFAVTGHSIRAGFATAAKEAGVDMLDAAAVGGWVPGSKAMPAYIRRDGADVGSALRGHRR